MSNAVSYGDISPRTAAFVVKQLLERAAPVLLIEKFGQSHPIDRNSTKSAKWRRYFLSGATGSAGSGSGNFYVPLALTPLVEGVTPSGNKLANVDYTVTLSQFGDYVTITDVVMDTHEDQVLQEAIDILGEQAAYTLETIRFNVLKAGTNVFRLGAAGATVGARNLVNGPMTLGIQRSITTALNRQNARRFTKVVSSNTNFRTEPVEAAYVALVHPDLETDIRNMAGFIPTKLYGTVTPWESEVGSVEGVRYLSSTIFAPWADSGAVTGGGTTYRSTTGVNWDVYPILYLARDAFGIVPLKGKDSITPMVVNPKPAPGDPLGQRGTVGWKAWQAAVILQDAFLIRAEVTATS
jgi:N4-gp56 family major capsid protein